MVLGKNENVSARPKTGLGVAGEKKTIFLFVFTLLCVVAAGIGVTIYLNRKIIRHHEIIFQEQQALQVMLAKQVIERRVEWLLKETSILGGIPCLNSPLENGISLP